MGWNKYADTLKICPKCGKQLTIMEGSWSEQPPDAFKLYCSCGYEKEITDEEAYALEDEYENYKNKMIKQNANLKPVKKALKIVWKERLWKNDKKSPLIAVKCMKKGMLFKVRRFDNITSKAIRRLVYNNIDVSIDDEGNIFIWFKSIKRRKR